MTVNHSSSAISRAPNITIEGQKMASLSMRGGRKRKGGRDSAPHCTIQFKSLTGRGRRKLTLGVMPVKAAEQFLNRVEMLIQAKRTRTAADGETQGWLAALP